MVAVLDLPPAVFKTCPWQPRELVEEGLRQWLRCCAAALRDRQVIGMPSHAVDEAWHGFHPEGGAPDDARVAADPMHEQLRRTVIAWSMVAGPGEKCVLWDLDTHVEVEHPWGIDPAWVADIEADLARMDQRV